MTRFSISYLSFDRVSARSRALDRKHDSFALTKIVLVHNDDAGDVRISSIGC
jgi:hypothetical protein